MLEFIIIQFARDCCRKLCCTLSISLYFDLILGTLSVPTKRILEQVKQRQDKFYRPNPSGARRNGAFNLNLVTCGPVLVMTSQPTGSRDRCHALLGPIFSRALVVAAERLVLCCSIDGWKAQLCERSYALVNKPSRQMSKLRLTMAQTERPIKPSAREAAKEPGHKHWRRSCSYS